MIKALLIGTDLNAYSVARSYHELYQKNIDVIGYEPIRFSQNSKIMNFTYDKRVKDKNLFADALIEYYQSHYKNEKVLLIPCHDTYVRLLTENVRKLKKYYIFNCPAYEIVDDFLVKEKFYTKYKNKGIEFPNTYFYDVNEKLSIPKQFKYPLIIKPSNGIEYYKHPFDNQAKVYKTKTLKETKEIIETIKNSGYQDNIIIQEFIEGDDSTLFDCVFYCNSKGKAQLATFAQIGLQEHGPTAIGNCTVLINGYNQFGETEKTVEKLKKFLESINYHGFAEFDLKYDLRDKKFKVLEINPRQARSSYYLTALGHNMIEYLVDDLFLNKDKDFLLETKEILLTMVPKTVIKKHIHNEDYKKKALELYKQKNWVDFIGIVLKYQDKISKVDYLT